MAPVSVRRRRLRKMSGATAGTASRDAADVGMRCRSSSGVCVGLVAMSGDHGRDAPAVAAIHDGTISCGHHYVAAHQKLRKI